MSAFRIHRATRVDVLPLGRLFERYRAFYGVAGDLPAAVRFLEERIAGDESAVFLASTVSLSPVPEAVGFVQLYPSFSSLALRSIDILNDLFVVPERRRNGIARCLIAAAINHARARGSACVTLETRHDNTPARALYRGFGFREDDKFARMSLALHDQR